MEIDRDEMGPERCKGNVVKHVEVRPLAETKFDNIPECLLFEVLIRVPVKLVFRSKLVSKQWLSVISDPYFVRMYISRASMSPQLQPWTFVYNTMHVNGSQHWEFSKHRLLGDMYSTDIRPPSLQVLRCPSAQPDRYKIFGVSSGLVLYGPCMDTNYNICNPITGQWIALPPHVHPFKGVSRSLVTRVENGVLISYRVVRLDAFRRSSNVITFEVFSSETGVWKDVNVRLDLKIELDFPLNPTSVNGILHWRTRKHGIIAYDPYHKTDFLHFISLPDDRDRASTTRTHLGIHSLCDMHQERLSFFKVTDVYSPHGFSSFSVWILNDYSTGDWSLQHRIRSSDILYHGFLSGLRLCLNPKSFHPFDSNIVYLTDEHIIVSYNIKTQKMEALGVNIGGIVRESLGDNYEDYRPCWWQTFLLVIPPWPIYIPPPSFCVT